MVGEIAVFFSFLCADFSDHKSQVGCATLGLGSWQKLGDHTLQNLDSPPWTKVPGLGQKCLPAVLLPPTDLLGPQEVPRCLTSIYIRHRVWGQELN